VDEAQLIALGVVARPHGLRGQLKVILDNPSSAALLDLRRIFLRTVDSPALPWTVRGVSPTAGGCLLSIGGCDDCQAAERLRGARVLAARADLAPLSDDQVYVADLVGCTAVDTAGRCLGEVVGTLYTGAHEVAVLRQGEVELLLPLVPAFLRDVDLGGRRMVVDPPEELPAEPVTVGRRAKPVRADAGAAAAESARAAPAGKNRRRRR
jgi:16S rRNA processing protein RimM